MNWNTQAQAAAYSNTNTAMSSPAQSIGSIQNLGVNFPADNTNAGLDERVLNLATRYNALLEQLNRQNRLTPLQEGSVLYEQHASQIQGTRRKVAWRVPPMVLVADEDASTRAQIQTALGTLGCGCVATGDAHAALKHLKCTKFDLILIVRIVRQLTKATSRLTFCRISMPCSIGASPRRLSYGWSIWKRRLWA